MNIAFLVGPVVSGLVMVSGQGYIGDYLTPHQDTPEYTCLIQVKGAYGPSVCIKPDGHVEITGGTIDAAAAAFYAAFQPMMAAACRAPAAP